jgi:hypothetical protein
MNFKKIIHDLIEKGEFPINKDEKEKTTKMSWGTFMIFLPFYLLFIYFLPMPLLEDVIRDFLR